MGEVLDKSAIEVAETQEGLKILNLLGSGPIGDCHQFGRVHANLIVGYDHAEVFDGILLKEAFLGFQEQVFLLESL